MRIACEMIGYIERAHTGLVLTCNDCLCCIQLAQYYSSGDKEVYHYVHYCILYSLDTCGMCCMEYHTVYVYIYTCASNINVTTMVLLLAPLFCSSPFEYRTVFQIIK